MTDVRVSTSKSKEQNEMTTSVVNRIAMNKLIDALVAFSGLKKTNDFFVNRVEHNY